MERSTAKSEQEVLMFENFKKKMQMRLAQKRMRELGLIIDTIDTAFIQRKVSDQARMDFWWRFISDQDYRKKFIQDMAKGLQ